MKALRSRLFWRGTETAQLVVGDYYKRMYGAGDIMVASQDVDLALANISEILGGTSPHLQTPGLLKRWTHS